MHIAGMVVNCQEHLATVPPWVTTGQPFIARPMVMTRHPFLSAVEYRLIATCDGDGQMSIQLPKPAKKDQFVDCKEHSVTVPAGVTTDQPFITTIAGVKYRLIATCDSGGKMSIQLPKPAKKAKFSFLAFLTDFFVGSISGATIGHRHSFKYLSHTYLSHNHLRCHLQDFHCAN